jgi:prepilin-type processing-associated H-X9-DG protein
VRRAAARSQCANNLKQIGLALHNYSDKYGSFPSATIPNDRLQPVQRLSWLVAILPFTEENNLYQRFSLDAPWDSPDNKSALETEYRLYKCADWDREKGSVPAYWTPYVGSAGLGGDAAMLPADDRRAGVFGYDRRITISQITDGSSKTLMVLESARDNGPWAAGGPATVRGTDTHSHPYLGTGRPFGGTHFAENSLFSRGKSNGCNFLLADGSVRFVHDAAPQLFDALVTIAGGEEVPTEW